MPKGILTTYRKKLNLTQHKVAELLGTTNQYISMCEKKDKISDKYIDNLSQIFHVRPALLWKQLNQQLKPETIKYYQKKADLKNIELSNKCNIYNTYIHNYVKGKVKLTKESDYYEPIKEVLNIPDEIIFPDCIEHSESIAAYELENQFIVFYENESEKRNYLELSQKYLKETIYAKVEKKIPLIPALPKGEIRAFPKLISNEANLYVIELENQILIASSNAASINEKELEQCSHKEIVNGQIVLVSDKEEAFYAALLDKILFRTEIIEVLKEYFQEVELVNKNSGTNTYHHTYRCDGKQYIIRYQLLNEEVAKITSIREKKE